MQRALSLRRQLDRRNLMQHRGQGLGTKKTVLLVIVLCAASVIFTRVYVAHITRSAASSQAATSADLAGLRASLHEEQPSLQQTATQKGSSRISPTDRAYSGQAARSEEGWADGGGDVPKQQAEVLRQEAARPKIGQHDHFIVVLSVDHDKHELLQATVQLWQVRLPKVWLKINGTPSVYSNTGTI